MARAGLVSMVDPLAWDVSLIGRRALVTGPDGRVRGAGVVSDFEPVTARVPAGDLVVAVHVWLGGAMAAVRRGCAVDVEVADPGPAVRGES